MVLIGAYNMGVIRERKICCILAKIIDLAGLFAEIVIVGLKMNLARGKMAFLRGRARN